MFQRFVASRKSSLDTKNNSTILKENFERLKFSEDMPQQILNCIFTGQNFYELFPGEASVYTQALMVTPKHSFLTQVPN